MIRVSGMKTGGGGVRWVAAGLAILMWAGSPKLSCAQGFSRLSVPVPVEIDGQVTRSKMYLKVDMKIYNQPFDQFASSHRENAEGMFVAVVRAVRKNDVAGFGEVWTAPEEMKSSGHTAEGKLVEGGAAGWMKLIRSTFDFDKLTVVAEAGVGPDTMFIWDSRITSGVMRRAFYVGPDKNGKVRLSAPGDGQPIQALLLDAFDEAQTQAEAYKPLPDLNLRYQYPIPLAGKLDAGPHPVFFQFDGEPMDFPIVEGKVKPATPLLEMVRDAGAARRDGKDEALAAAYTPKSQAKVRQWLVAVAARKLAAQKVEKAQPPKPVPTSSQAPSKPAADKAADKVDRDHVPVKTESVKFVINADPIFLVFQARASGVDWKPEQTSYSYVVRDGQTYKFTNFEYGATLDEFLHDPALFDKNVLKPAPAKLAAPKSKASSAPAKPAGVTH